MSERIRVLVVDDSTFVRRAVQRMLESFPDLEVVGTAHNGARAVELVRELQPHVVVLDVNMPEVDGLEALRRIMKERPTGVVMLSSDTQTGAQTTLIALELGAVDFVDKSSAGNVMDIHALAPLLRDKIRAAAAAAVRDAAPPSGPGSAPQPAAPRRAPLQGSAYDLVVVGASTGGPRALVELLSALPADFGAAVAVAQHMPPGFTQTLAERLNRRSALRVAEARDGDPLLPGHVLVSPGGSHLTVRRTPSGLVARVADEPADVLYRPSVDLLFDSAAEACGPRAVGVVLTGMGDDGAHGLRTLREAGAYTLAESRETAVIYGMPRAAASAAEQIVPLYEVAPLLTQLCACGATNPERKG